MTYYDEKEKQNDIDKLQTIKQCLLEENEKIKRFKEALKEKLVIYQERIEFLKVIFFGLRGVVCLNGYLLTTRIRNSGRHMKCNR